MSKKVFSYDLWLKSLRKSEEKGMLNSHIVNLRDSNEALEYVLQLARAEKWDVLEKNIKMMLARPSYREEEYETTIDFLDACDALRKELESIPSGLIPEKENQ